MTESDHDESEPLDEKGKDHSSIVGADFGEPQINFPLHANSERGETETGTMANLFAMQPGFEEQVAIENENPSLNESLTQTEERPLKSNRPRFEFWKTSVAVVLLVFVLAALNLVFDYGGNLTKGAGWQAFSEQLPKTIYIPDCTRESAALANPVIPTETPDTGNESGDRPESLTDALDMGKRACEERQFAEAVNHFLAGLKILPDSNEAKLALDDTIEKWTRAKIPVGKKGANALEKASKISKKANSMLVEYYLQREPSKGLRRLEKSAAEGYTPDMVRLGLIYSRGKLFPYDMKKAVDYFRRAAEKEDPDGLFYYGECLVLGEGMEPSVQSGMDYLKKAADLGDTRALTLLGICQVRGTGGIHPDAVAGADRFEDALQGGDHQAYANLALRYAKGDGREKDPSKASEIFEFGAISGDPESMLLFAKCLSKGYGIEQNPELAEEWYSKSAKAGNQEAIVWCDQYAIPLD